MAFGNFKSLQEVALAYEVSVQVASFVQPIPLSVDERVREELEFAQQHLNLLMSEAALCENLIAPVLRAVWKPYRDTLLLWSHVPLGNEEPLAGTPDYYLSRRSPLGFVADQPYVLIIEAKKDDFEAGWGQCLAAMLAAQRMNGSPCRIIHGCVSTGRVWQFGKLEGKKFTQEPGMFILSDLPALFAAWNYIFIQAREQALLVSAA